MDIFENKDYSKIDEEAKKIIEGTMPFDKEIFVNIATDILKQAEEETKILSYDEYDMELRIWYDEVCGGFSFVNKDYHKDEKLDDDVWEWYEEIIASDLSDILETLIQVKGNYPTKGSNFPIYYNFWGAGLSKEQCDVKDKIVHSFSELTKISSRENERLFILNLQKLFSECIENSTLHIINEESPVYLYIESLFIDYIKRIHKYSLEKEKDKEFVQNSGQCWLDKTDILFNRALRNTLSSIGMKCDTDDLECFEDNVNPSINYKIITKEMYERFHDIKDRFMSDLNVKDTQKTNWFRFTDISESDLRQIYTYLMDSKQKRGSSTGEPFDFNVFSHAIHTGDVSKIFIHGIQTRLIYIFKTLKSHTEASWIGAVANSAGMSQPRIDGSEGYNVDTTFEQNINEFFSKKRKGKGVK